MFFQLAFFTHLFDVARMMRCGSPPNGKELEKFFQYSSTPEIFSDNLYRNGSSRRAGWCECWYSKLFHGESKMAKKKAAKKKTAKKAGKKKAAKK